MTVALQRKVIQVLEQRTTPSLRELAREREPTRHLRHFHVDQLRGMQRLLGGEEAIFQAPAGRARQQELEDDGGVDDDQRASRSARTAAAGASEGETGVRSASRARISSGVARSAARRTICSR